MQQPVIRAGKHRGWFGKPYCYSTPSNVTTCLWQADRAAGQQAHHHRISYCYGDGFNLVQCTSKYAAGHKYTISSHDESNSCKPTKVTVTLPQTATDQYASAFQVNLIVPRGSTFQGPIITDQPTMAIPTESESTGGSDNTASEQSGSGDGSRTGSGGATQTEPPSDTNVPSGGLSLPAKVAIGLVVPVVVLIVALIAAFLLWRRQKRKRTGQQPTQHVGQEPSMGSSDTNGKIERAELRGNDGIIFGTHGTVAEKQELDAVVGSRHESGAAFELTGNAAQLHTEPWELTSDTVRSQQPQELPAHAGPLQAQSTSLSNNSFTQSSFRGGDEPWRRDYSQYNVENS